MTKINQHQHHHHPENEDTYKALKVNKGVAEMPTRSPYLPNRKRKRELSVDDYVDGILRGNLSVLSRAVTLVESSLPSHQAIAQEVIERCLPHSGNSKRIGITGVPGAGKSTFIEALGMYLVKEKKSKLAVLAIDPSSERSKGSILGDKTRMEELSTSPNAFIRPSPSAGSLGGVARKTRESVILCEAAGFDTIFVETVGVGQSETAVHSMVDFFLLIQLAGTGDELQGIKRGIMEMADGIVVNKADGNNIEKSELARQQFKNALSLFPKSSSGWTPNVLTCSATQNINIDKVWDMIIDYLKLTTNNDYLLTKRNQQSCYWMYETINDRLKSEFYNDKRIKEELKKAEKSLLNNKVSSFVAAYELLELYKR